MERKADIKRKTSETDISLKINLDDNSPSEISTGVPFLIICLVRLQNMDNFVLKSDAMETLTSMTIIRSKI